MDEEPTPPPSDDEPTIPHGLTYEKSILSTLLKHPDPYVGRAKAEGLTVEHFHIPAHKTLFQAILATPVEEMELVSFIEELHRKGELDGIGGRGAVAEIYTYAPNSAHWSLHVRHLREYLARRRAFILGQNIRDDAGSADADRIQEMLSYASESVSEALQARSRLWTAERAVEALRERMDAAEASETGTVGFPTGIYPIDAITGGLAAGDLWVVSAETSGGKTALMLQIAAHFAAAGKSVFIDSLEIQKEKVIGRLATTHVGTPYNVVTKPKYAAGNDKARLAASLAQVSAWNLTIDDEGGRTVEEIAGMAEMARDMMGGLDLIVVDYLQRVRPTRTRKNESREQEVAHISASLKTMAMRLQIPVLTASQLNDDGRLRESRAIGQDADVVLKIASTGIKTDKVRDSQRDQLLPVFLNGDIQTFEHRPEQAEP